jgi:hypothetical protein
MHRKKSPVDDSPGFYSTRHRVILQRMHPTLPSATWVAVCLLYKFDAFQKRQKSPCTMWLRSFIAARCPVLDMTITTQYGVSSLP